MLRTGFGILSNVKIIIQKKENRISCSHWTDEKSGNPEKAGRMASLQTVWATEGPGSSIRSPHPGHPWGQDDGQGDSFEGGTVKNEVGVG